MYVCVHLVVLVHYWVWIVSSGRQSEGIRSWSPVFFWRAASVYVCVMCACLYVYMNVCIFVCVCMYVCVCMHVNMDLFIFSACQFIWHGFKTAISCCQQFLYLNVSSHILACSVRQARRPTFGPCHHMLTELPHHRHAASVLPGQQLPGGKGESHVSREGRRGMRGGGVKGVVS